MPVEPHTVPSLLAIRPRYWLLLDAVAGAGYGVLTFVVLANEATGAVGWLAALVGAGCLGGPIWSRRRMPICAPAVLLGATAVLAIVHPPGVVMALPPLVLTLYTVAAQCSVRSALIGLLSAAAVLMATSLPEPTHPGGIIVALPVFAASWALGLAFGLHRRHLGTQLELRERIRGAEIERGLTEQRVLIARELHDVVAHGVSVITVQAGFAGLIAEGTEVRSALHAIETTARQTLVEMRHLLDGLREEGDGHSPGQLSPSPGLCDVDDLVAGTRAAGVQVTLAWRGTAIALSPLVELQAYRIIQEALTNVVKHAPGSVAAVEVEYGEHQLIVTVRDDGPEAGQGQPGHGIIGMSERAAILGGTLDAGPLPDRGYQVTGRLPATQTRAPDPRPATA